MCSKNDSKSEEMAQSVERLLCKQKDLSSIPNTHIKAECGDTCL